MSVVKMKLLTIAGHVEMIDEVIADVIIGSSFHLESSASVNLDSGLHAFDVSDPYAQVYGRAAVMAESLGIELGFEPSEPGAYDLESCGAYLDGLEKRLRTLEHERLLLKTALTDNVSAIERFQNVRDIPERLSALLNMKYVKFRFGRMPKEIYDGFIRASDEIDDMFFFPTVSSNDYTYGVCLLTRGAETTVDNLLGSLRFERIILPYTSAENIEGAVHALEDASKMASERIAELEKRISDIRDSERTELLSRYSWMRLMSELCRVKKYAAWSGEGYFTISGWVPAKELAEFADKLEKYDGTTYVAEDPSSSMTVSPPVRLKNNFLGRIFEPFVEMYGLPAYNEIDPSFLMAVTYTIMFGIMYGDVGQGIVLIFLGYALYKLKGMWLGRVLSCVGFSACAFGFVFGSVFGYEELIHGFNVLATGENTTRILLVAVAIGMSVIAFMMVLNICNGIKQKNKQKVFFEPNGLCGLVLYCSAIFAGVELMMFGNNYLTPAYILLLIILPLLLIFCREPLGKLLSGSKDWKPESIPSFIMENFFELFEVILSYVTNTISFLRVGAYAISHAGMMMVVYMLAESGGGYNIAVIAIGNVIVMGIEGLLVCIQVLRLEFYEMFGRFYESGGKEYVPLKIDYTKI